ncbi:MAG: sugar-binding protein [Bacteroidales bacterium]
MDGTSFTWSGLWDDTNLYLLVRLKDDVVTIGDTAGGSAAKNWMNDNISGA